MNRDELPIYKNYVNVLKGLQEGGQERHGDKKKKYTFYLSSEPIEELRKIAKHNYAALSAIIDKLITSFVKDYKESKK